MTEAPFKKEYADHWLNGSNTRASGDGSETANAALMRATLALDRMERHEAECGRRWGIVMKMMFLVLTKLGGLLSFLVADKLGWFV
ncbi:hypothetical protein KFE96_06735 [Kordiimonas sp. SCSIO 12603]|nr:hypothetical protein [Kordiimonas sp. SCSIO 12603]UTW59997.1 hypothetical protein KFE96_06735 [Kordiimonas sp. SCSIO 12603]